ncbi:MAG: sugar ABC transporter permease [candidate division NC10 bacterium]|nr:sugar ABC transporter permease [candidate division NC10 bacterium]
MLKPRCLPYILIFPAALTTILMVGWPIVQAVQLSLYHSRLLGVSSFAGLDNFRYLLFEERIFREAARNTLLWIVVGVACEYVYSLSVALLLNRVTHLRRPFTIAIILPWIIPPVVAALIWQTFFDPFYGIVNELLTKVGVLKAKVSWLGEARLVLPSLIAISVWRFSPMTIIVFLAGLQSIPRPLYEAAEVDGATRFQCFRFITLPMLAPITIVILTLKVVWRARHFDLVWALTEGGPGHASELLATLAYKYAIVQQDAGLGSTVAVVLLVCLAMFMIYVIRKMLEVRGA